MASNEEKLREYLKLVTADLRQTRQRLQATEAKSLEPIAIVSMACQYPGASSPEGLWDLVAEGRDAITEFPTDRGWNLDTLYHPDPEHPNTTYTHTGGFLTNISHFDAHFFNIAPREATAMDPQQRLLLETTWHLLERAHLNPTTLKTSPTGVFIGAGQSGYIAEMQPLPVELQNYSLTGNVASVLSGRVSYALGFEGPAVTIDTACSSSLVAMHWAVQALRQHECSLAVTGGVTLMSTPRLFVDFSRQRGLSVDGRCKSFAAAADGTGWGEGIGLLLLERLSDAQRNGHQVLAILRGSAINQDGASSGLTAPNGPSQQRVIQAALDSARLSADQVDVVEAHGTGTTLGDPIEAQALLATYGKDRSGDAPLWLGSVKSNIGHTAAAAGVAGVIKMVLALRHGVLPKTLHVDTPSPEVDWSSGAVELLTEARPWPEVDRPRRAGVSSFGISGTNAHVILEQAPVVEDVVADARELSVVPWVVSGKTGEALRAQAARLVEFVADDPALSITDVAFSLVSSRAVFEHRGVVVGADRSELVAGLSALAAAEPAGNVLTGVADSRRRPVFVFPGQGSQWAGMALGLLDNPVFASSIGECEQALSEFVDWSLTEVLRGTVGAPSLERVDVVQPVLWAVMVSLAAVWRSYGAAPAAVIGHSQGEIAAAVVAGGLTLEDGAKIVALRSLALLELAGAGGMVSIALPVTDVEQRLADWGLAEELSVATVNGPATTVVSGAVTPLDTLLELCERHGVRAKRIPVDYASHSVQVETLHQRLLTDLAGIEPVSGEIPFYSTVTTGLFDTVGLNPEYWYQNLRQTVRFHDTVQTLTTTGHHSFIETSPHPVLVPALAETEGITAIGTLRRDDGDHARLLTSLAQAHAHGITVDWQPLFTNTGARLIDLPTYAFQHQRYWLDNAYAAQEPALAVDELDARFWQAVEDGDLETLATDLDSDTGSSSWAEVLPALSSWRRRRNDNATIDSWRYRIGWKSLADPDQPQLTGHWLLVAPADLNPARTSWCELALGSQGARLSTMLVPAAIDRETLTERLRSLAAETEFAGVLSLIALDEQPHPDQPAATAGLAGTLNLLQALGDAEIGAALWCLTGDAVRATVGDELTGAGQAQVWGLGRVAALEYPHRWGGLIDLPVEPDDLTGRQLVAILSATDEDQVALRPSGSYGRRLHRANAPDATSTGWQPRGTVLVTGGTGVVGGQVARWLARHGAEHLVLTSRRGDQAPGARELQAELSELGVQVTLLACDITDRDQLAAVLRQAAADAPLRAVIHTAATIELASLEQTTVEHLGRALSAKVRGAELLVDLVDGESLDAIVLFSSITGIWGSGDHGAYAAANAQLDAVAERGRIAGLPITSVAWGIWDAFNEQDAEDRAVRASLTARSSQRGLPLMPAEQACAALGRILGDEPVAALADVDWPRFTSLFTSIRRSALLADLPEATPADQPDEIPTSSSGLRDRLLGTPASEQRRILIELVSAHAAAILGHGSAGTIEPHRAFRDLGFDSVTAVELRNRLNAETGLRLPATLIFDHPSATALAEQLRAELLGAVAEQPATTPMAATDEPIAIVAMACRYPGGVSSPQDLWRLLSEGGDAIGEFPAGRGWDVDGLLHPDPDHPGTSYVNRGGFYYDADRFDPAFFGISPREALAMDPQQRLLLEASWETFERAGIDPGTLKGSSTGTFVGSNQPEYGMFGQRLPEGFEGHLLTGSSASVISGRIAYTFGLEGPAITVETACSSSLVALHLACQAIRSGECSLALAAGVAVLASPTAFVGFSRQRGLAADGRCKAFGADADGMGLAEGVGVVLVERLSDARRNGHRVLAVVAGSAVNQDGASNGLSAPNGPSQQRVIRAALASAGLTASDVDVVEAHGTGTTLGDPIEAQALLATYGRDRSGVPLWLGSVKSNIGHTAAAAGVAGVIKMVLALQHGVMPKTLHADTPSAEVDWSTGGVELLTEARPWPEVDRPRRAGVSSFGISGTNAHVILEQAPVVEEAELPGTAELSVVPWLVSGKTEQALRAQAARLVEFVAGDPELSMADVAFSLVSTRAVFEHRGVVVGADRGELLAGLSALAAGEPAANVVSGVAGSRRRPVFVFPGQGSQWVGMALGLLDNPVFASSIGECERALSGFVDWSLTEVLRGTVGAPSLERVDVVQPVLWAVMVSLAAVWRSFGVRPAAVVGHSQGEIAAAVVAGGLSLIDGAKVVALRSLALLELAGQGGMVSIALPVAEVERRLADWNLNEELSVATVNGPAATVVSGATTPLDTLLELCERHEVRAKRIPVDYASHSVQVEAIHDRLLTDLAGITPTTGEVPFYSTVTTSLFDTAGLNPEYWYQNLRQTVRFHDTIHTLTESGHDSFIETSPHPVLIPALNETESITAIGTLRRDDGDQTRLLTSLAQAQAHGITVDWTLVFTDTGARLIELPTYAFQRESYWLPPMNDQPTPVMDELDARFWQAVEDGDLETLATDLDSDTDSSSWAEVLPALSSWRRRRNDNATIDSWQYRIGWQHWQNPARPELAGRWLLVSSDAAGQPTERVADALREHGAQVVPISCDRRALADAAAGDERPVAGVMSLLALDEPEPLAGTLALVQAMAELMPSARLWCLTRGAVGVPTENGTGAESGTEGELPDNPAQAQLWGFGRVVALEQPERWGGLIDLPAGWDDATATALCQAVAGDQDQVAIRHGQAFVRRLLHAGAPVADRSWQPRGTALVAGGCGPVTARVARWLVDGGAERVVLVAGDELDAGIANALAIELSTPDVEVSVATCRPDGLAELVHRLAEQGAPVRTVFHTEAGGDLRLASELAGDELGRVLRARLELARAIADLPAAAELDAMVFFTSITGVWGAAEHAGFAAASAEVDALAERLRGRGVPAVSVAWAVWDAVAELAAPDPSVLSRPERQGVPLLDSRLALVALGRILAADQPSAVIAGVDWPRFAPLFTSARPSPLLAELAEARAAIVEAQPDGADQQPTVLRDRLARLGATERRKALVELVRQQAAAALGHAGPHPATHEVIGAERSFKELGVDSLIAVELRNRLNASTGLALPATLVFDYPTPAVLAGYLHSQVLGDIEPAEAGPLAELARLESMLLDCAPDGDLRATLAKRLQALARKWTPEQPATDEDLVSATAGDIFDLIDRELG